MQKNVLITGGYGFVGSHLYNKLKKEYKIYRITQHKKDQDKDTFFGNVTDWNFINKIFKDNKIHYCLHLASQALVDEGTSSPLSTLKTNIEGTWNILEASRQYYIERIIVASTTHVYGDNKNVPYKEYYTPRPSRIYETSKACADVIAQSYKETYGLPVFIPRFTNIYGPGDLNFSRIIPKTISSILNGESPTIWGGKAIRDYLYVEDAVDAYVKLLNADMSKINNHIFNIGSDHILSVKELVKKIIQISQVTNIKVTINKNIRKDEIMIQHVSSNKAKRILKWRPKYSLDEGLKKTYEWYKDNV